MVEATTRDERVSGLVGIGEKELTGEDEAEVDAYFAPRLQVPWARRTGMGLPVSRDTSPRCERPSTT